MKKAGSMGQPVKNAIMCETLSNLDYWQFKGGALFSSPYTARLMALHNPGKRFHYRFLNAEGTVFQSFRYYWCHSFSLTSISSSLIETSRVKSGQRTFPDKSVETLNLFWQSFLQAHIEQYFLSAVIIPSRQVFLQNKNNHLWPSHNPKENGFIKRDLKVFWEKKLPERE